MYFLINELSFSGQFSDKYEASQYMDIVRQILKELKSFKNLRLLTHHSLSERELSNEYRVRDWLRDYTSSSNKDKEFINLFFGLFKETCISKKLNEEVKNGLYYWECHFNKEEHLTSSLAGAAYLKGNLVSLQKIEVFNAPLIVIHFKENDGEIRNVSIPNIFELIHAQELRPKFCYHRKHDPIHYWDDATPMDLKDDEAQEALDQSLTLEGHTQRYSYYKSRFYVFQNDNAGGYHGYPIEENKVPNSVLKQLKDS